MSPGTLMLFGGIAVFIAATITAVYFRLAEKRERDKLEEELRKDY